uniref:VP2 protein n=1 Tax=Rousettus bat polyomavirus TaxID=3141932 RepID=A0AAU7E2V7_9POLY
MGIVASIVAAIAGVAEAVADAAAAVGSAAGAASEAVATSIELTSALGQAAEDTVPLLAEEEETVFDSSWVGENVPYADEGAINDPWNWEMEPEALASTGSRVPRALGATLAVGAGLGAAAGGLAYAFGSAAASKTEAGQALLEAGQQVQHVMEAEGLEPTVPDIVMGFMTPEEYEWALEELHRRQAEGHFDPESLEAAENALVYISPKEGIPFASKDPSLLMDVATSKEPAPWFLPGAAGQPLTRGMARRAAEAARVMREGQERSQVFRLSSELRRELQRTGAALDQVYREVRRRDNIRQENIAARLAAEVAGQALDLGLQEGERLIGNVLGGGVMAGTIAAALTGGASILLDKYFGPSLPEGSIEIEDDKYSYAPQFVKAQGGLWRKGRASYLVEEDGHIGTVNLSYYAPEQSNRHLPSTEPWYHFPPRNKTQLDNLKAYLANNWGGTHSLVQPTTEGLFLIGDLVLQEAQYRRKNARPKRRPRNPGPRPRPKRTRRARN